MYLENVVFDATEPRAIGRFWESALGTEQLTDEPAGYETRLAVPDGPVLDLCFQQVSEPPVGPQRLQLQLAAGEEPGRREERLLALGARAADGGAFVDPGGNPFRLAGQRTAYDDGPLAALALEVADPVASRDFWAWLSGWTPAGPDRQDGHDGHDGPVALQHPSQRGPLLELRPEAAPKGQGKNRIHLDVRLERGDDTDALAREVADRGGREVLHPEWGSLPWRFFEDPSGNEFCLLPAPVSA